MSNSNDGLNLKANATLAACLRGGRLSHASLVEGGSGTLEFAKQIARAVLCSSPTDKPCGVCRDCLKTAKDVHPDLLIYSGGEKARSFHIETVRELRQEAFIRPNEAENKVFVLENVQNMTVQAQNALLKIIEEPPNNVSFVLTCQNKSVLLETILSRVSVFSLDDVVAQADEETSEMSKRAEATLNELISGSELQALAAFAPFERDRQGMLGFLEAIRSEAAKMLIADAKENRVNREKSRKLAKIVEVIDEIEVGLNQNVSGLLMSAILSAKFKLG